MGKILFLTLFYIHKTSSNPFTSDAVTESELKERLLNYYDPNDVFYQLSTVAQGSPFVMDIPNDSTARGRRRRRRRRRNLRRSQHYGNACPGSYVNNTNSNRMPSVIAEWRCSCQRCQLPPNSVPYRTRNRYSCRPIYQLYQTLHTTDRSSPSAEWKMRFEPISVGCKCEAYRPISALVLG